MAVPFAAHATTVNGYTLTASPDGNACSGLLGTSPTCVDLNGSPQIIKFDFNDNGEVSGTEINPLFPSIDGTEFSFDFGTGGTGTGTWYYAPDDATDPGITSFTAKGGNGFNWFVKDGPAFAGIGDYSMFSTPTNASGNPAGLSNLTFFDSATVIPLPAAGWLLLGGIGGLAALRRKKAA